MPKTQEPEAKSLFDFSRFVRNPARCKNLYHWRLQFDSREAEVVAGLDLIREFQNPASNYGGSCCPSDLSGNHLSGVAHFHGKTVCVIDTGTLTKVCELLEEHVARKVKSQWTSAKDLDKLDKMVDFINRMRAREVRVVETAAGGKLQTVTKQAKRPLPSASPSSRTSSAQLS